MTLFRTLFGGRTDAILRWANSKTDRAGYSPACANEWVTCMRQAAREVWQLPEPSVRPSVGRGDRGGYLLCRPPAVGARVPGLRGGVYPLLLDETRRFLAADFDGESWARDALAYIETCRARVSAALERSRSGEGGHVWIFFSSPYPRARHGSLATCSLLRRWIAGRRLLLLRSALPQPGHHPGRRLRQPDCITTATPRPRARQQSVRRR